MNEKIEEKRRLNNAFEVFDPTFEKFGLELIGKGISFSNLDSTEVFVEMVVNDKNKLTDDLKLIVNMYNIDNCIAFHEEEYIEVDELDDLFTIQVTFYETAFNEMKNINKIRIYLTKD